MWDLHRRFFLGFLARKQPGDRGNLDILNPPFLKCTRRLQFLPNIFFLRVLSHPHDVAAAIIRIEVLLVLTRIVLVQMAYAAGFDQGFGTLRLMCRVNDVLQLRGSEQEFLLMLLLIHI